MTREQRQAYEVLLGATASTWSEAHLARFSLSLPGVPKEHGTGGKNAMKFAAGIPQASLSVAYDRLISRTDVVAICADANTNISTACAAILAWGGMRLDHRDYLVKGSAWLTVAEALRNRELGRKAAYQEFLQLRKAKALRGMGAAFFTKLICFLAPRGPSEQNAYIMDQWAGSTVNLLAERDVLLVDVVTTVRWNSRDVPRDKSVGFLVSDRNTADDYETFCVHMDALARHLQTTPDHIDRAAMGEGSGADRWRPYLKEHRKVYG